MRFKIIISPSFFLSVLMLLSTGYCFGQSAKRNFIENADTLHHIVFHFRFDKTVLDSGYIDNNKSLFQLEKLMKEHAGIDHLDSIVIVGSSSPEGVQGYNDALAKRRSVSIGNYILWKYPSIERSKIHTRSIGENWDRLKQLVANDNSFPYQQRITEILDSDISSETKLRLIKQAGNGAAWVYITRNYLRYLRTGMISVFFYQKKDAESSEGIKVSYNENDTLTVSVPEKEVLSLPVVPKLNTLSNSSLSAPKEQRPFLAVKTNLAAYVGVIANLGVEIPIKNRLSIDLFLYYSPYTISDNYKFSVLAIQPELRYWFKNSLKGHFLGAHLVGGYYNIAFNSKTRYQDADGNSPAYGGGISYGYAINLGKKNNWGMEFTAGFGYLHLNYDMFYNVANGAKFDTKQMHYWGLTKFGINLIYKFNKTK